jgi:NADPH:quinone reductase-like Zn-dependent oxidoreductase
MKAAWIDRFGDPDVIRVDQRPPPERRPGEVLVKMMAATLNHHDIFLRRGETGRTRLPMVLGSDGSGSVVEADASSRFDPQDRVVIYPVVACGQCRSCLAGMPHKCRRFGIIGGDRDGTLAELVAVPEACLVELPDDLDFESAAAISLAGLTAWNMVMDEGKASRGEHALVLGASGGVGTFTVRLLKRQGLTVHAVTSSPAKRASLEALGADSVLDDSPGAVLRHTRQLPEGGVDIAFNPIGGDSWRYVPPAVRAGGRILVCGALRSPVAEIDMRQLFYRSITLIGCSMGTPEALRDLLQAAATDITLRAPVDRAIALEGVAEAHRWLEDRAVTGKIAVRM